MKISTLGQTTKRHNIRYGVRTVSDLRGAFRKKGENVRRNAEMVRRRSTNHCPVWENVCCFACLLPTTSSSQRSASEEEGAN